MRNIAGILKGGSYVLARIRERLLHLYGKLTYAFQQSYKIVGMLVNFVLVTDLALITIMIFVCIFSK